MNKYYMKNSLLILLKSGNLKKRVFLSFYACVLLKIKLMFNLMIGIR